MELFSPTNFESFSQLISDYWGFYKKGLDYYPGYMSTLKKSMFAEIWPKMSLLLHHSLYFLISTQQCRYMQNWHLCVFERYAFLGGTHSPR
jgi:hypothetical protein